MGAEELTAGPNRRLVLGALAAAGAGVAAGAGAMFGGEVRPPRIGPMVVAAKPVSRSWSVAAENRLRGTKAWRITRRGPDDAINGFTDRVSVRPGESFQLFVSTTARTYGVTAYRLGWYGGDLGREVWRSGPQPGRRQSTPQVTPGVNLVTVPWGASMTIPTGGWPEGVYVLKLVSEDGFQRYVPLTIRSDSAAGRAVFVNAVTTWAAYNKWGLGYNLYSGPDVQNPARPRYANRARKVTFDRPMQLSGAPHLMWYELPQLALAERNGLPLAYATDLELHADPALFRGAHAMFFPGHDEYWSSAMRDNALAIRDAGTNIAFFGANMAYRHIRFEDSDLGGRRTVICYKHATEDPILDEDPAEATQQWRLGPDPRPESVLTGVLYESNPVTADFRVVEPDHWIFQGTGATFGQRYRRLVGIEYDRLMTGVPVPRPLQVLSDSPLVCRGVRSHANSSYYTTSSGAGVFSTGSLIWSTTLPVTGCNAARVGPAASRFAEQVSRNVMTVLAKGPAALTHPAEDTYDTYARPPLAHLPYTYEL